LKFIIDPERLDNLSPPAKERALAAFEALAQRVKNNPLELYLHPDVGVRHEKQIIFHGFSSKVRLFLGGNQSGKTTGGLADDLIQALPEKPSRST
jgi:hypothetical protein